MPISDDIKEDDILRVAAFIYNINSEIFLMGGSVVAPSILGTKRARPYSRDIDFFAKEEGFERIQTYNIW